MKFITPHTTTLYPLPASDRVWPWPMLLQDRCIAPAAL